MNKSEIHIIIRSEQECDYGQMSFSIWGVFSDKAKAEKEIDSLENKSYLVDYTLETYEIDCE